MVTRITNSIPLVSRSEKPAGPLPRQTVDSEFDVRWFAVHAKRHRENLAASNVRSLEVEVFLPQALVARPARGETLHVREPLFPGYFFARFSPASALKPIASCPGVLQVVSSGRSPLPIEDRVIDEIHERMEPDGFVPIRSRPFQPGDRICIDRGPLEGMMGRVERELREEQRVAILLDTLWQARVLVDRSCVRAEAA